MNLEQLMARQQAIVDGARAAGRDLTAEEVSELQSLQRDIDAILSQRSAGTAAPAPQHAAAQTEDAQRAAAAAERNRINEINALCRDFGVDPQSYIDNGSDLNAVRSAVLEGLRTSHAPVASRGTGVNVTADAEDKYRAAASDGLMMRSGVVNPQNPAEGARDFSHMSLRDLAIDCLSREGEHTTADLIRMSNDDLYGNLCRTFYNPASAFPAIMDSTIRKSIVQMYNEVPTTFEQWTGTGSLQDFKESPDHEYVIGGVGDFLIVPENGEIKADKPRTEILPNRKVDTYGKSFSMTRQAFINDDIGFLAAVPGLYAQKAKMTIDKQCYKVLFDNRAIKFADKKTLFHADHKNLAAAASKPTQAAIQAMILQMQKQTDQFGEAIYMAPANIIVPVGYEFDLAVIFHSTQVTGSNNNDINPLYNYNLNVVQSPVLNALAGSNACPWFMTASQASARGIQVDYLNGQKVPTVRRMEAPGTLGFTWDIYLDWGIAVRDFRGVYKNAGAVL